MLFMEKNLRVKLFGESLKIHKLKIDIDMMPTFIQVAKTIKLPFSEALLDIYFFRVLNMKKFQSLNDLIGFTFSGLINNYRNQVEITYGRKRLVKFNIDELFKPTTLFPIYNTEVNFVNMNKLSRGIYIEEKEIGLIGTYDIVVEKFQMDLLNFHLVKIELLNENLELLHIISYNEQVLQSIKSDVLLRCQRCFIK